MVGRIGIGRNCRHVYASQYERSALPLSLDATSQRPCMRLLRVLAPATTE